MGISKVSAFWRMFSIYLFGAICGVFLTLLTIASKINNGDTINIGKIKIKNAHDIELPIIIDSDPEKELTRKEKRKLRKIDKDL